MEEKVQVYINVNKDGSVKDEISGMKVIPEADYDYYFFLEQERANNLGSYRVVIDENMKPQLVLKEPTEEDKEIKSSTNET